jgi:hypothetical protein
MKKPSLWDVVSITQNSENVTFLTDGDSIQFNAIPDGGNIVLIKSTGTSIESNEGIKTELGIPYPVPSSGKVTILYSISKDCLVNIAVYDIMGNKALQLVNENKSAGNYSLDILDGKLRSGVYFVRMNSCGIDYSRKFIVID